MGAVKNFPGVTDATPSRSWLRFGLLPPEEKLDIAKAKPYLELKLAAFHSDGHWFYSTVIIDKDDARKHDGYDGALGALQAMNDGLRQLATYRDCSCLPKNRIICKTHEPKEAS